MKEPDVKPATKEKDVVGLVNEIAGGRMSRRQFIERGLVMGLSVSAIGTILAACGRKSQSVSTATLPPMVTTKPKALNLFNWSDYMSPGVKKSFQKTTGIAVNETYYADNETLLAKLKLGATGYDVIVPSDYMVHIMLMSGLLQPLDMKYIPNYDKYVGPIFKDPPYDDPKRERRHEVQRAVPVGRHRHRRAQGQVDRPHLQVVRPVEHRSTRTRSTCSTTSVRISARP